MTARRRREHAGVWRHRPGAARFTPRGRALVLSWCEALVDAARSGATATDDGYSLRPQQLAGLFRAADRAVPRLRHGEPDEDLGETGRQDLEGPKEAIEIARRVVELHRTLSLGAFRSALDELIAAAEVRLPIETAGRRSSIPAMIPAPPAGVREPVATAPAAPDPDVDGAGTRLEAGRPVAVHPAESGSEDGAVIDCTPVAMLPEAVRAAALARVFARPTEPPVVHASGQPSGIAASVGHASPVIYDGRNAAVSTDDRMAGAVAAPTKASPASDPPRGAALAHPSAAGAADGDWGEPSGDTPGYEARPAPARVDELTASPRTSPPHLHAFFTPQSQSPPDAAPIADGSSRPAPGFGFLAVPPPPANIAPDDDSAARTTAPEQYGSEPFPTPASAQEEPGWGVAGFPGEQSTPPAFPGLAGRVADGAAANSVATRPDFATATSGPIGTLALPVPGNLPRRSWLFGAGAAALAIAASVVAFVDFGSALDPAQGTELGGIGPGVDTAAQGLVPVPETSGADITVSRGVVPPDRTASPTSPAARPLAEKPGATTEPAAPEAADASPARADLRPTGNAPTTAATSPQDVPSGLPADDGAAAEVRRLGVEIAGLRQELLMAIARAEDADAQAADARRTSARERQEAERAAARLVEVRALAESLRADLGASRDRIAELDRQVRTAAARDADPRPAPAHRLPAAESTRGRGSTVEVPVQRGSSPVLTEAARREAWNGAQPCLAAYLATGDSPRRLAARLGVPAVVLYLLNNNLLSLEPYNPATGFGKDDGRYGLDQPASRAEWLYIPPSVPELASFGVRPLSTDELAAVQRAGFACTPAQISSRLAEAQKQGLVGIDTLR